MMFRSLCKVDVAKQGVLRVKEILGSKHYDTVVPRGQKDRSFALLLTRVSRYI